MSSNEFTTSIEYPHPFDDYIIELCRSASRYIHILSPQLDHAAFDNPELTTALSALARSSRQTQVRILISDSRQIVSRGHQLLRLAQRLPSTVLLQLLAAEHPDWNGETVVIRDRDGVLYKPGGSDHDAFFEPDSRASASRHLDLFEELWRHSVKDAELRSLQL